MTSPLLEPRRFWLNVEPGPSCWEWRGRTSIGNPYARIQSDGVQIYAHRLAWESVHGPVPKGMFVCHRCDNPKCVRPSHLFLGTHGDNQRDRIAKNRPGFGVYQPASAS